MATAMQETPVSLKKSVAERTCRNIICSKLAKEDENVAKYLRIWEDELVEQAEESEGGLITFYTSVTLRGKWAAELAAQASQFDFPETRKMLANRIVDAWLNCNDGEDQDLFAKIIREWPPQEAQMMANTIRSVLQFRNSNERFHDSSAQRIVQFLMSSKDDLMVHVVGTVYRTMFKALASYGSLEDLVCAAQAVHTKHIQA